MADRPTSLPRPSEVRYQRANDARRLSEERYRTLFEYAPDGILIADRDGRYIDANASICRMLGYTHDELVGLQSADIVVPSEVPHIAPALAAIIATPDYSREWEFLRKDATTFCADVMATATPDGNLMAIIRDNTARNEATHAVRTVEAKFQHAQKMEAVGRLAGGVAHDFNNLLTVILGFCEILLADVKPGERHVEISEIQKAGMRAAGLTRQLLAFSRKEITEPKLLDLNAVLADMRPMLARLIKEDVRIVFATAPAVAPVKADRGQLEQVVINLAINAQDAMPTGGTLTIETANITLDEHYASTHFEVKPGAYVALTITDSGTGMSSTVLDRLFEPFFTTKALGKGTGLGLASVHGIVNGNGGIVNVYSEVDHGSTFSVYLPRAVYGEPISELPTPAASPTGTETVLLVEDSEALRELTMRLLERQGYKVIAAANATEAQRLFEWNPAIAVLLTDVVMPGCSGPELWRRLAERRPGFKVIYMSGYTDEAIVQHGVLKPGIAFLHKPFTSSLLGHKIRETLDRQAAPGEV